MGYGGSVALENLPSLEELKGLPWHWDFRVPVSAFLSDYCLQCACGSSAYMGTIPVHVLPSKAVRITNCVLVLYGLSCLAECELCELRHVSERHVVAMLPNSWWVRDDVLLVHV
jgi:hypothetical protein